MSILSKKRSRSKSQRKQPSNWLKRSHGPFVRNVFKTSTKRATPQGRNSSVLTYVTASPDLFPPIRKSQNEATRANRNHVAERGKDKTSPLLCAKNANLNNPNGNNVDGGLSPSTSETSSNFILTANFSTSKTNHERVLKELADAMCKDMAKSRKFLSQPVSAIEEHHVELNEKELEGKSLWRSEGVPNNGKNLEVQSTENVKKSLCFLDEIERKRQMNLHAKQSSRNSGLLCDIQNELTLRSSSMFKVDVEKNYKFDVNDMKTILDEESSENQLLDHKYWNNTAPSVKNEDLHGTSAEVHVMQRPKLRRILFPVNNENIPASQPESSELEDGVRFLDNCGQNEHLALPNSPTVHEKIASFETLVRNKPCDEDHCGSQHGIKKEKRFSAIYPCTDNTKALDEGKNIFPVWSPKVSPKIKALTMNLINKVQQNENVCREAHEQPKRWTYDGSIQRYEFHRSFHANRFLNGANDEVLVQSAPPKISKTYDVNLDVKRRSLNKHEQCEINKNEHCNNQTWPKQRCHKSDNMKDERFENDFCSDLKEIENNSALTDQESKHLSEVPAGGPRSMDKGTFFTVEDLVPIDRDDIPQPKCVADNEITVTRLHDTVSSETNVVKNEAVKKITKTLRNNDMEECGNETLDTKKYIAKPIECEANTNAPNRSRKQETIGKSTCKRNVIKMGVYRDTGKNQEVKKAIECRLTMASRKYDKRPLKTIKMGVNVFNTGEGDVHDKGSEYIIENMLKIKERHHNTCRTDLDKGMNNTVRRSIIGGIDYISKIKSRRTEPKLRAQRSAPDLQKIATYYDYMNTFQIIEKEISFTRERNSNKEVKLRTQKSAPELKTRVESRAEKITYVSEIAEMDRSESDKMKLGSCDAEIKTRIGVTIRKAGSDSDLKNGSGLYSTITESDNDSVKMRNICHTDQMRRKTYEEKRESMPDFRKKVRAFFKRRESFQNMIHYNTQVSPEDKEEKTEDNDGQKKQSTPNFFRKLVKQRKTLVDTDSVSTQISIESGQKNGNDLLQKKTQTVPNLSSRSNCDSSNRNSASDVDTSGVSGNIYNVISNENNSQDLSKKNVHNVGVCSKKSNIRELNITKCSTQEDKSGMLVANVRTNSATMPVIKRLRMKMDSWRVKRPGRKKCYSMAERTLPDLPIDATSDHCIFTMLTSNSHSTMAKATEEDIYHMISDVTRLEVNNNSVDDKGSHHQNAYENVKPLKIAIGKDEILTRKTENENIDQSEHINIKNSPLQGRKKSEDYSDKKQYERDESLAGTISKAPKNTASSRICINEKEGRLSQSRALIPYENLTLGYLMKLREEGNERSESKCELENSSAHDLKKEELTISHTCDDVENVNSDRKKDQLKEELSKRLQEMNLNSSGTEKQKEKTVTSRTNKDLDNALGEQCDIDSNVPNAFKTDSSNKNNNFINVAFISSERSIQVSELNMSVDPGFNQTETRDSTTSHDRFHFPFHSNSPEWKSKQKQSIMSTNVARKIDHACEYSGYERNVNIGVEATLESDRTKGNAESLNEAKLSHGVHVCQQKMPICKQGHICKHGNGCKHLEQGSSSKDHIPGDKVKTSDKRQCVLNDKDDFSFGVTEQFNKSCMQSEDYREHYIDTGQERNGVNKEQRVNKTSEKCANVKHNIGYDLVGNHGVDCSKSSQSETDYKSCYGQETESAGSESRGHGSCTADESSGDPVVETSPIDFRNVVSHFQSKEVEKQTSDIKRFIHEKQKISSGIQARMNRLKREVEETEREEQDIESRSSGSSDQTLTDDEEIDIVRVKCQNNLGHGLSEQAVKCRLQKQHKFCGNLSKVEGSSRLDVDKCDSRIALDKSAICDRKMETSSVKVEGEGRPKPKPKPKPRMVPKNVKQSDEELDNDSLTLDLGLLGDKAGAVAGNKLKPKPLPKPRFNDKCSSIDKKDLTFEDKIKLKPLIKPKPKSPRDVIDASKDSENLKVSSHVQNSDTNNQSVDSQGSDVDSDLHRTGAILDASHSLAKEHFLSPVTRETDVLSDSGRGSIEPGDDWSNRDMEDLEDTDEADKTSETRVTLQYRRSTEDRQKGRKQRGTKSRQWSDPQSRGPVQIQDIEYEQVEPELTDYDYHDVLVSPQSPATAYDDLDYEDVNLSTNDEPPRCPSKEPTPPPELPKRAPLRGGLSPGLSRRLATRSKHRHSTEGTSNRRAPLPRPRHSTGSNQSELMIQDIDISSPPPPLPPRQRDSSIHAAAPTSSTPVERSSPLVSPTSSATSSPVLPTKMPTVRSSGHLYRHIETVQLTDKAASLTDITSATVDRAGNDGYRPSVDAGNNQIGVVLPPAVCDSDSSRSSSPTSVASDNDDRAGGGDLPPYLELLGDEDSERVYEDPEIYRTASGDTFLTDEPLYQVYHQGALLRGVMEVAATGMEEAALDDDIYSDIPSIEPERVQPSLSSPTGTLHAPLYSLETATPERPIARGVGSRAGGTLMRAALSHAGHRRLWSEMEEVKASEQAAAMSDEDRKLQEALFEIITSEASYLKSLNLLMGHFVSVAELSRDKPHLSVITPRDHLVLFSNVHKVRDVSHKFLKELEVLWRTSCVLDPADLCSIITRFTTPSGGSGGDFDVYIKYLSNKVYQDRKLATLLKENPQFREVVDQIETTVPVLQGLGLASFLLLPMQRITRLPLLVDAVCHRMDAGTHPQQYPKVARCMAALQKLVKQCNEGARQLEQLELVASIDRSLSFKHMKKIPLVSQSRSLVKKGSLTRVLPSTGGKLLNMIMGKRESLFLYLFNDLLLITKKKSENCYHVIDSCPRISVHADIISDDEVPSRFHGTIGSVSGRVSGSGSGGHLMVLALLESSRTNRAEEYVFSCTSMSERLRWVESIAPANQESEDEKIYESWDCPQVQAVEEYSAQEPDELSLEESDVINVFRKMADGWYEGERIRDGQTGWFPGSCTVAIDNAHIRARNLKQRYRMLTEILAKSEWKNVHS